MLFSKISQELLEVTSNPEENYAFMRILPFDVSYENLILERQVDENDFEINQLLILLVKSLHVIGNVGPQASQNIVKHLIDALTAVFECKELKELQKSLIRLISYQ